MKRYIHMDDISDGKLYTSSDLVRAHCMGCGSCCRGMGTSIILDPLDMFRLTGHLNCTFEAMMQDAIELNVVDGLILPNLKMKADGDCCAFLDSENRCRVHGVRPGICRLFPLGRYYENRSFRYFLQIYECKNSHAGKVKVKKWLEEANLAEQEAFISRWHYFLKDTQELLDQKADDGLRRQISMYILQKFYIEPLGEAKDFYRHFEARVSEAEQLFQKI